jgi:PTH1 family peptidyl-tRNA hydrolase
MVVGLGNPGPEYEKTRHNFGFRVLDRIAAGYRVPIGNQKYQAAFGSGKIGERDVVLVKPMAFMNRSGPPVWKLARKFQINSNDILVVHDDIDLAFGRIKIKEKGGHGGHNGLKSLVDAFGGEFPRIRMGIGRPEEFMSVTDHVLGRFSEAEREFLDPLIAIARDAAAMILVEGTSAGMNRFNNTKISVSR